MFKYLVGLSAITIALVAAYFSVTGIATLFSGKFIAVVAMASALEIGKLVASSFLYRYWKTTAALLKTYLVASVAVLMVITSVGIYGYLSAAYAEIAAVPQNTINELSFIDVRQSSLNSDIQRWIGDNATINARREQVQTSLDNILNDNTNLSQRSAFANLRTEIELLDVERRENNDAITTATFVRDSLESAKVGLNAELNTNSEIGTFIYIARSFDLPLDTVVKWFVLIIVVVFDPLAISLILAYNSIVVREQRNKGPPDGWEKTPLGRSVTETMRSSAKAFSDLTEDWPEERKERVEKRVEAELETIDDPYMPTVDEEQVYFESAPDIVPIPPTDPIENGWSLAGGALPIDYDKLPYFRRPGYDWSGRRKEWEKDPIAVEYYEKSIKS